MVMMMVVMMRRGTAPQNCSVHCDGDKQPPHVTSTAEMNPCGLALRKRS